MSLDTNLLQHALCESLCADVVVHTQKDGTLAIETPFVFDDGDVYSIFIREAGGGALTLTDLGHTLMQLSYSTDIEAIRTGNRGSLLERVLAEAGVSERKGELFLKTTPNAVGADVIRFGQALTRLHDISFLNRARVESTFFEDLERELRRVVTDDARIDVDYVEPSVPDGALYKIPFKIQTSNDPLFLFGVTNADQARLATITLQKLQAANVDFESLIVFADQAQLPRDDLARLSNVGGEMVASLDAREDFERKVRRRVS